MTKLAVIMDPIAGITPYKDTTLAMLLEAQRRDWELYYIEQQDLFCEHGSVYAHAAPLSVFDDAECWYQKSVAQRMALTDFDVILMRKDPPFNMAYIYTTYMLDLAKKAGVLVVNDPQSLRDVNEKFYISMFPQCTTPTLISQNMDALRAFLQQQKDIILKPLDGMGGVSIFRLQLADTNTNVIIETITQQGTQMVMAQRFISEISAGDKRIIMIDGKAIPYALARIPAAGENRANLAAGGSGVGVELSARDHWICEQIGPTLRAKGLTFVGLDIIGDYLTEINVTSPTCVRELEEIYSINICAQFIDVIEQRLNK